MKKIIFLIALSICALTSHASTLFDECENIKGITTVYVSKAMIALAGDLNIEAGDVDFNSIANKIEEIEIMTADQSAPAATLRAKAKAAFKGNGYEKLMSVHEDDENVDILMQKGSPNRCIILADQKDEMTVVILSGNFTVNDIVSLNKK